MTMYRVEVLAVGERTWATNALKFSDEDNAFEYAKGLYSRWALVSKMRVVPLDHPLREAYVEGSEHPFWKAI